jgi:hypothetical protein
MRHNEIDWVLFCSDGTIVHGHQPARAGRKKARRRATRPGRCTGATSWSGGTAGLKWCRRVTARYEKLATHYLAIAKAALVFRLLGLASPDIT